MVNCTSGYCVIRQTHTYVFAQYSEQARTQITDAATYTLYQNLGYSYHRAYSSSYYGSYWADEHTHYNDYTERENDGWCGTGGLSPLTNDYYSCFAGPIPLQQGNWTDNGWDSGYYGYYSVTTNGAGAEVGIGQQQITSYSETYTQKSVFMKDGCYYRSYYSDYYEPGGYLSTQVDTRNIEIPRQSEYTTSSTQSRSSFYTDIYFENVMSSRTIQSWVGGTTVMAAEACQTQLTLTSSYSRSSEAQSSYGNPTLIYFTMTNTFNNTVWRYM